MGRYIKNYSKYCFAITCLNLSVFVLVGASSKCATLYSSSSHQGNPVSLTDGAKLPNLPYRNFVPQSVRVTPGCFLTIIDVYGNRQTLDKDSSNLVRSAYSVLDAACCECGGCSGAADKLNGLQCASLFENPRCDSCSGYRLDLNMGDQARNFGPLNNKMTSIAVRSGCTLTAFDELEFRGWRNNFTKSSNMMGDNWYKQISSAKCGCEYLAIDPTKAPNELPTYPTRAPITLPTVPTRAPITLPTVPTRAPITLPTVPTRAPITLPTVPTRAPITLPTVPTRAPITLPTVPTYPPMTLPTVPTTSSRPPITLPTVPTTTAPITLPTVPTTTQTTTTTTEPDYYGGTDSFEIGEVDEPPTPETPESESEEPDEEDSEEWW